MSFIGSAIETTGNMASTAANNIVNYEIASQNRESQEEMNDQNLSEQRRQFDTNYGFQREQYEYQKQLQQEEWQREDSAIQRQVADARLAGISPLANMQGASSSLGSTSVGGIAPTASPLPAPQLNTKFDFGQIGSFIMNGMRSYEELKRMRLENSAIAESNDFNEFANRYRKAEQIFDTLSKSQVLENLLRDSDFKRYYGITDSMTKEQQVMQVIKRDLLNKPTSYAGDANGMKDYKTNVFGGVAHHKYTAFDFDNEKVSVDDMKKLWHQIVDVIKPDKDNAYHAPTQQEIDQATENLFHMFSK